MKWYGQYGRKARSNSDKIGTVGKKVEQWKDMKNMEETLVE